MSNFPVAHWLERDASNAEVMSSIPGIGHTTKQMYFMMQCQSLSAKCVNVNVEPSIQDELSKNIWCNATSLRLFTVLQFDIHRLHYNLLSP